MSMSIDWATPLMKSGTDTTNRIIDNLFNRKTVANTLDAQKEMNAANNKSTETIAALLASQKDSNSSESNNTVLIVVVVIVIVVAAFLGYKMMKQQPKLA